MKSLNNPVGYKRRRKRTLLIIEGNHEEQIFLPAITKAFPEVLGSAPDVIVYRTNIYVLYKKLEQIYGTDWTDIDLPYVISIDREGQTLYKRDFINTILIFDYERHDPEFSESRICLMQSVFCDMTDNGQLYLNYPMVESYWDFTGFPDDGFINRKAHIIKRGREYKSVLADSFVKRSMELEKRIEDILKERFYELDSNSIKECTDTIEKMSKEDITPDSLRMVLERYVSSERVSETANLFADIISRMNYWSSGDYHSYLRNVLLQIMSYMVQKGFLLSDTTVRTESLSDMYSFIDYSEILDNQNRESRDSGYVWVLNTGVLFVVDYNKKILEQC